MLGQEDFRRLAGMTVVGTDGSKIGKVDQLYADREDGHPTFLTVSTGLFGSKTHFVPLDAARIEGDSVAVPYDKSLVSDAPSVDPDSEITPEEEQRLYSHYGVGGASGGVTDYETTTTDTGRVDTDRRDFETTGARGAVGNDVSGPETDDAMTRSEERLRVDKERVQTGRARLRKWVETENVSTTVPVTRERVTVEREPITDANVGNATSGPELSEEEHEVTLTEERAVVTKETVPVERVRLGKETVTEDQTVSEEIRKERIETDGIEGDRGTLSDNDLRDNDRR